MTSVSGEQRQPELIAEGERLRLAGVPLRAEPVLREALALALRESSGEPASVAAALNALGLVCKDLAKLDEARALYERALELLQADASSSSYGPELATLHHNLAGIEHSRGDYASAETIARLGIAIRESVALPDDPALAADLAALAAILDGAGKLDEGEAAYTRALSVLERSPSPSAREIAMTLNGLGALHARRGLTERAEEVLARAVELGRHAIGARHPEVAVMLNNLGVVRRRLGAPDDASRLHRQALSIFEQALGADHPKTVACRRNLDRCAAAI